MEDAWRNAFETVGSICKELLESTKSFLLSLNPKQEWVMWIQLVAGAMTVLWIIIQFAAWRRLNEARFERYLEDRIDSEREDLARERQETLSRLDRAVARRGIKRAFLLFWAHFVLTMSFVLRLLSLDTVKGLSNHSGLLLQVGRSRQARRVYLDIASEAAKKIKRYEDALTNARLETQNALIFAGRVAILEERPAAAVATFRKALTYQDDPEVSLMVAQQIMSTDPVGALQQINSALEMPEILGKPTVQSELYRSIAKIRMAQNSMGRARNALRSASQIDMPLRYFAGIAATENLRGDLYAPRAHYRNAALTAYQTSIDNYRLVPDAKNARLVEKTRQKLLGNEDIPVDGWWTRRLERRGASLLRRAATRRDRANKKAL